MSPAYTQPAGRPALVDRDVGEAEHVEGAALATLPRFVAFPGSGFSPFSTRKRACGSSREPQVVRLLDH